LIKSTNYEASYYAIFSSCFFLAFHSQTPSISVLPLRATVSHPYKTTGKIMVLYFLISKILERRQEDKTEQNGSSFLFLCECNFNLLLLFPNTWTLKHS